jgi:hypothetical protein
MTVKVGEQYKACALLIKDSNLICQTGNNSPAFRPEIVDLSFNQRDRSTTTISQAIEIAKDDK